ncbi:hypothetical protein [Desulfurella sp.]|uniref:hypothetical protein n=1 Tax=Desulfurella sp. TaxID=1962857 RepID=UPI0025C1927B|nr:hypothetical protein [Desulfurella sp.]
MLKKLKFFFLGAFLIGTSFYLQGCAGYTTAAITSAVNSKYEAINLQPEAEKNIQQAYNAALDTQKQYPTGTVDVVFNDLAVRMNPTFNTPVVYLNGSKYLSEQYIDTVLAYAKQVMPDVNFVVKDKPDFSSQNPQLVLFPSFFNHTILGFFAGRQIIYNSTYAIFELNGKYYAFNNEIYDNGYPIIMATVFSNFFKDYYKSELLAYYPIFPAVKAIMLKAQNQPLSPYLERWLNAVKQWQPAPVNNDKVAFRVVSDAKLPCVYNYKWTEHKKNAQGKEYGKTEPEWYQNLKGIAPYLFMPEDSTECQKIEKKVKNGTEITQAILEVVAENWKKETKPIMDNWDKVSKLTVGADNQTLAAQK